MSFDSVGNVRLDECTPFYLTNESNALARMHARVPLANSKRSRRALNVLQFLPAAKFRYILSQSPSTNRHRNAKLQRTRTRDREHLAAERRSSFELKSPSRVINIDRSNAKVIHGRRAAGQRVISGSSVTRP